MKSADGGGRSRPPIPGHKPPAPERRPPIPAHKPPPPRPSAAPASSGTGNYSPPPQAERDGVSPTTAALVTALAMSAASQNSYGGARSVSELLQQSPILRILWWLLGWAAVVSGILFALGSILLGEQSEFWGGLIFSAFGLVMAVKARRAQKALQEAKSSSSDKVIVEDSITPPLKETAAPTSTSDWKPM